MEKLFSYLEGLKAAILGEFAKLSASQTELADAKADLAKAKEAVQEQLATIAALNDANVCAAGKESAELTDLKGKLSTAQELAATQAKEITELKENLTAAEAGAKEAQKVIASQGLSKEELPEQQLSSSSAKTAFQVYNELLSAGKSAEAGAYFAANSDKIISRK
jgi:chromosome segregation ATPase